MSGRIVHGWQVMLADLALILFLTTAAALDSDQGTSAAAPAGDGVIAPQQEPVAVFRPGEVSLSSWLADRSTDPRETLTILVRHTSGQRDVALAEASRLASEAAAQGLEPRIVVEPGSRAETTALFAFAGKPLARPLLREGQASPRATPP